MTNDNSKYMTEATCNSKHRPVLWVIGASFVMTTLILMIVGWSLIASQSALASSMAATQSLEVYKAGQDTEIKHLSLAIVDLRTEIRELKGSIDRLYRLTDTGTRINRPPVAGP